MERWYRATGVATRTIVRALDVRLRYTGLEHLPRSGPVVLASNHVSYPDFLWIGLAAHERDRWRAVPDPPRRLEQSRRRAMVGMGHVPVDREAPAAAYLAALRLLREGEAVCVFPEAGISWSYAVRSLMRGPAALARETGAPLVPVALWGTQRIWSVGRPVDGSEAAAEPAAAPARRRRVRRAADRAARRGPRRGHHPAGSRAHRPGRRTPAPPRPRAGAGRARPVVPRPPRRARPRPGRGAGLDDVPRSAVPPSWGPPTPTA